MGGYTTCILCLVFDVFLGVEISISVFQKVILAKLSKRDLNRKKALHASIAKLEFFLLLKQTARGVHSDPPGGSPYIRMIGVIVVFGIF